VLVLSRRIGESIVLRVGADRVTITVLEVRGDVVRVGIEAPRSVRVHRAELLAQLALTEGGSECPSEDPVDS
jgi:carbon storage regulator